MPNRPTTPPDEPKPDDPALEAALQAVAQNSALLQRMQAWVSEQGGTQAEAEAVLASAVASLEQKLRKGQFPVANALDAYFFGIVRSCWLNWCRRKR